MADYIAVITIRGSGVEKSSKLKTALTRILTNPFGGLSCEKFEVDVRPKSSVVLTAYKDGVLEEVIEAEFSAWWRKLRRCHAAVTLHGCLRFLQRNNLFKLEGTEYHIQNRSAFLRAYKALLEELPENDRFGYAETPE
jgi:hypothetical protein